jgi:hypothetical protein
MNTTYHNLRFHHSDLGMLLQRATALVSEAANLGKAMREMLNEQNARNWIRAKFLSKNRKESRLVLTHVTCATDTTNVNTVFNYTRMSILNDVLRQEKLY